MARSWKIVVLAAVLFALALLVISLPSAGLNANPAHSGSDLTCGSRNCPNNTKCCFDCSGNPICVKPGVMCPVCIGETPAK